MEKNFYYRGHCIHRSNDDLKALVSINVWCVVLDGQIKLHIVVAYKDFNFMWWVKCSKFGILGSFGSFISRENSNAGWNWGTIIYNFLMADLISVHQPVTDAIIMIALLWNWSTQPTVWLALENFSWDICGKSIAGSKEILIIFTYVSHNLTTYDN